MHRTPSWSLRDEAPAVPLRQRQFITLIQVSYSPHSGCLFDTFSLSSSNTEIFSELLITFNITCVVHKQLAIENVL